MEENRKEGGKRAGRTPAAGTVTMTPEFARRMLAVGAAETLKPAVDAVVEAGGRGGLENGDIEKLIAALQMTMTFARLALAKKAVETRIEVL